jgi:hypothetical protein
MPIAAHRQQAILQSDFIPAAFMSAADEPGPSLAGTMRAFRGSFKEFQSRPAAGKSTCRPSSRENRHNPHKLLFVGRLAKSETSHAGEWHTAWVSVSIDGFGNLPVHPTYACLSA